MCLVFVLSGHKFKDVETISGKYEPGPWYGASLRTKKLVPQDINTLCGSREYPYPPQGVFLEIPREWGFYKDTIFKGRNEPNMDFSEVLGEGLI